MERTVWRGQGRCKDLTIAEADKIFFVGRGQTSNAAKAFCGECPVRRNCLDYAIVYSEEGIWAGTTDKERQEMRKFALPGALSRNPRVESRNINDFIPQQRQPHHSGLDW